MTSSALFNSRETQMNMKIGLFLLSLAHIDIATADTPPFTVPNQDFEKGQQIILGSEKENPYSLSDRDIEATHLYIKFMPEDKDQEDRLSQNHNLEIFKYPIHREILQGGEYYIDELIAKGTLPYQYAIATVKSILPNVPYEILDRLSLPEMAHPPSTSTRIKIDGNTESRATRHGGNITLWDDYSQSYKPVAGLNIRATSWFRTTYVTTDINGNFRIPFSYWPVGYSYEWDDSKFVIQHVEHQFQTPLTKEDVYRSTPLAYHSPTMRAPWNVQIGGHHIINTQVLAANAWLAAKHYFYGDIPKTTRPTELPVKPLFASKKITIGIDPLYGNSNYKYGSTAYTHLPNVQPRVFLYLPDLKNTEKSSTWMFYLTLHELAHVVHFDNLVNLHDWGFGIGCKIKCLNNKVREGWAVGVANELTRAVYPNFDSSDENPFSEGGSYTGIITDMIDPAIEGTYDEVSGYTLQQIEVAIQKGGIGTSFDLNALVNSLKNLYNNPTEKELDALVKKWGN